MSRTWHDRRAELKDDPRWDQAIQTEELDDTLRRRSAETRWEMLMRTTARQSAETRYDAMP